MCGSSVGWCLPSLYRALGSTPSMLGRKRKGVEEIEKRRTFNAAEVQAGAGMKGLESPFREFEGVKGLMRRELPRGTMAWLMFHSL